MVKALVRKELREIAGITALAVVAYVMAYGIMVGAVFFSPDASGVPFVDPAFEYMLMGISFAFAVALAMRQSVREHSRQTYLFLLHRPLPRRRIVLIKCGVGLAVLLTASGACVLAYALWAATPGTHPSPFFWSMTEYCWWYCFGFSLVYMGALLSGLRKARWFGTRLLPLVASVLIFYVVVWALPGFVIPAAALLFIDILLAAVACQVAATQDYS